MELVKNIFFNTDKLVENSKVKISYAGKLFQNGSEEVYIHYGFGLNWDNLGEIKMEKTELGFQAEVELPAYDTFNFCFRDGNNNWDNNQIYDTHNYPYYFYFFTHISFSPYNYKMAKNIGIAIYDVIK